MRILILISIITSFQLFSQTNLIINTEARNTTSLNGSWHYIVDPYENGYYDYRYTPFDHYKIPSRGAYYMNAKKQNKSDRIEYNFDKSDVISVPGDWNSQKENLFYYEGTVWYKTSFDYKKTGAQNRQFVYFGAVNYIAEVYLNGKKLGTHVGGFTPFNFEITDLLKEKDNFLVVKVDNKRAADAVPTLNTDWWNYGGITRDVKIIETPANFIRDYKIQLDKNNNKLVKGFIQLDNNEATDVTIQIDELNISEIVKTDNSGYAEVNFGINNLEYWSPENPKLYTVKLTHNNSSFKDHIGFRTIKVEGTKVILNDEPIFLKGICLHEEFAPEGRRANSEKDAIQLFDWLKELGCNYVRLAHYPHNEYMLREADRRGIMVWEEIPVYWTIAWKNKSTYNNAENQLVETVTRDKNRASLIIYSMANETPNSDARLRFLTNLAYKTREMDDTRLISAALELHAQGKERLIRTIVDPFAEVVDILSFNLYLGWYDGRPDKCSKIEWKIKYNKPVTVSEFGAGAKYGFHGDNETVWSEEFQAHLYEENLKMFDRLDQLAGLSPWILVDFRSPRRVLPEIQDGWNRKGLISDKGEKKEAFYILQKAYKNK